MKTRSKLLIGAAVVLTYVAAAQAQLPGVNSTLQTVFTYMYEASTNKPTYAATQVFTPSAAATDICSITGSATKTIRVRRIIFSGNAVAVVTDPIAVIKRSTANTAGSGVTMAQVPYDSGSSAGTVGTAEAWTNAPTVGTAVGTLADLFYTWNNLTTGVGSGVPLVFTFGQLGSPLFLRGIAQQVSVNLGGLTYTTPSVSCTFEWTEE